MTSTNTEQVSPRRIIVVLALILVTAAAFWPSLYNGFVGWDDPQYLLENPHIQELSWKSIRRMFTSYVYGSYHPLVSLTFAVEHHFWGFSPAAYHSTNLALHFFNVIFVYFFILMLGKEHWTALTVAALFALHPTRVESVAWVTERKDVLFAFFYLSALILYLFHIQRGGRGYFYGVVAAFVLSSLSKPAAVSLPLILIAVNYFKGRKLDKEVVTGEILPLFVLSAVFGLIALNGGTVYYGDTLPAEMPFAFWERVLLACGAVLQYLVLLCFPFALSSYYPYPPEVNGLLPAVYWTAPLAVAGLVWFSYKYGRDKRLFVFGLSFFLLAIFFNLPVYSVGHAIIADRFTYLPYIGLFLILAEGLRGFLWGRSAAGKRPSVPVSAAAAIVLLSFAALTWQRCHVWRDDHVLWSDVISKYPNAAIAYYNRGLFYAKLNLHAAALVDFSKAIELLPGYDLAYNNRGITYYKLGREDLALADFKKALAVNPHHVNARRNLEWFYRHRNERKKSGGTGRRSFNQ